MKEPWEWEEEDIEALISGWGAGELDSGLQAVRFS